MDLKEYYGDMRKEEGRLERAFPEGVIYVTSQFYRERNSTPGHTLSASVRNAARVITDGTHRLATEPEINGFLQRQQEDARRHAAAEQRNKKQYIVVVDQQERVDAPLMPNVSTPAESKVAKAPQAKT